MAAYIGAVDQGTTGSRFILFDKRGRIVAQEHKEHRQIYPQPGWVEHDPIEIWSNVQEVIRGTLAASGIDGSELRALGVTNQRETALLWDRHTGKPYCNAVVWQCTRTHEICKGLIAEGGSDRFREKTGLPVATYFSGPKITWMLEHVAEAKAGAQKGDALFGTIETWLIWWLTGGPKGGAHVSDVTNAGRTMLMDLKSLQWDEEILRTLNIPPQILPRIVPSSDSAAWGTTEKDGPLGAAVPVCGALGDQQAALLGQACFAPGEAKNTYGTGCFLLMNTGQEPMASTHGLITTPAYQFSGSRPHYCLEGSIAIAGALVQWLRDNLGMFASAAELEAAAMQVEDAGGMYMVPAFSGLFAPYWRSDARGVMVGLTRYINRKHMARAVLEATAYQSKDIVEAMGQDSGVKLSTLKADGGMVRNELLMQFQSDILDVPVLRPKVIETTSLGAAYAAGIAVGFWSGLNELRKNWEEDKTWFPNMLPEERRTRYQGWKKAVDRTFDWID
jgi:glycerol kinase